MYLVAVALCAALSLVDISGAQSCVGRNGQATGNCGHCTVKGDPHITTYDPHTLINGTYSKYGNPITRYEVPGGFDAKYAISQLGKGYTPLFGVSAHFKQCQKSTGKSVTCVSSVTYNEPGLKVELILPVKVETLVPSDTILFYCNQDGIAANDPLCATKIIVNGITSGSVPTTPGIFKVGECNSYKCHIVVVGSKGITVSLLVDPTSLSAYFVNVYAQPSLHNQLFGLCDTFTRTGTNHYTPRYGSVMCVWSKANIKQFIETWKTSNQAIGAYSFLSSGQPAFGQAGSAQLGFGQAGSSQPGFGQAGSCHQPGFGQAGFVQEFLGQQSSGPQVFGQQGFGQLGSGQQGFAQRGSGQQGFAQRGSGQQDFAQRGSGQQGFNRPQRVGK